MNTMLKRIVSLILCLVMVAGYMPVNAHADESGETVAAAAAEATTEPSAVETAEETAAETTEETESEKSGKSVKSGKHEKNEKHGKPEKEEKPGKPEHEKPEQETTPVTEATVPVTEATVPATTEATVPVTEETVPETSEETEPTVIAVTGITLDQTALEVGVGAVDLALTATVQPEDATDKTVTWTSSEPGVASVDENGALTIGYMGEATITATAGEFSATCTVTVGEGEWTDYAGDVIDAAIFCSDVHGNDSTVTSVFNGIKNADSTFNPTTASFVGDTQCAASSVTSAAQKVFTDIACYYAFGNHDDEGNYGIADVTGLVYGDKDTNYYIYAISENSMASQNPDTTGFTSTVAGLDKSKPLFIISHLPLHSRRGDSNGAAVWYPAIEAAAKQMDIFFFWAHNHTGERDADRAAYYVAKNGSETITLEDTTTVVKPNFTYANAGYIQPPNTPKRNNVATAVRIYDDSVNLTVYNASGELSGTYAVNETVTREFAGSTGGDSGETETTTLTSIAVTKMPTKTTYSVGDTFSSDGLVVTATYSDESTADVTEFVELEVDMTTAGTKTVKVTYGEDNVAVETSFEITINEVVADDAVLSGIAITTQPTTLTYEQGSQLNLAGMVVTANFEDGTTAVVTDYEVTGYDANTLGEQTITVSYTHGEGDAAVTKTATFNVTVTEPNEEASNEVTLGNSGVEKTVYVLTDSLTNNGEYLIVNTNAAGNGYAMKHSSGTKGVVAVTIQASDAGNYIELNDSTAVWTATTKSEGFELMNGSYYLEAYGQKSAIAISTSRKYSDRYWVYDGDGSALGYFGGNGDHYIYYSSSSFVSAKNSGSEEVYIYGKQTINTGSEVKYTMRAENLKQVVSDTSKTGKIDFCLQGNGSDLTTLPSGGSYSFTEVADTDNIIASIGNDGTVNFTGTIGTATVKVAYTWTQDGETHTVYKKITVETTAPYYELDLHKANSNVEEVTGLNAWVDGTAYYTQNEDGTYTKVDTADTTPDSSVTYYAVTYTLGDEITDVISIKGIEAGDQYGVWAVVKSYDGTTEDGTDMGSVANDIEWSSSDKSVATVDPISGIITFTGKDGTVNITATYKNGNKPADTITISVTQQQYNVPADGTTDFPEYPNEGAIRFDKTATAVGNFSETGIAQLELSMTGVPYTAGSEIDVVVMLDITGSMHDVTSSSYDYSKYTRVEASIEATMAFVKSIVVNEDGTLNGNRVGIYSFNSGGTYTLYELAKVTSLDTVNAAIKKLNDNYKSGGTPYDDGLSKVQSVLNTAKTDGTGNKRQQFAIFMTDGVPTDYEYISGTSHANYSSASSIAGMLKSSDNYCTRDTDYKYEYYSTEMKKAGVTVYSVGIGLNNENSAWSGSATQCLNLASRLLNDISGPAKEITQPDAVGTSTLSKMYTGTDFSDIKGKYFFSVDDDTADDMSKVFTAIALEVRQAATDITVEDKITDEYTMIFDIPTGDKTITGVTDDFYIEFVKYTLDATNHERVDADKDGDTYDDATSVTKLYLKNTNGVYSAAKDSTGTAYDAPVFANTPVGDKGTLYYWTTDSGYASKAALSYTSGNTTYYFVPYGIKATDDGYDATKWFNMTSGGYAYGTIEKYGTTDSTNMSKDLVIATPYFVYNAKTKMIYWTLDKLENATTEYALRYFLYLDNSATEVGVTGKETDPGSYPTNDHAYITYTNFKKNECRREFPIPQLTWSGAQVSYVFYLVNAQGQPINKSGQVVDFANATFVTDVYTENTVWNKGADGQITADSQLSIDWLAANLLPSDYKVYDEAAKYQLHVFGSHTGESIFDYFTIGGNDAATISSSLNDRLENVSTTDKTVSLTTTKVYNTKAGEKITGYGTYTSKATDEYNNETVLNGFDFYNTTVAFAVVWQPALAPDTIVVDYGLDVLINVTFNDLMQDNTISGIGLSREAYGSIAENTGISTTSILSAASKTTEDGSTISIEPNAVQIRFSQNDMTFEKPVTFYYESAVKYYESSEQKDGYLHSSVTVIPATTIYYEDEYVDFAVYKKGDSGWAVDNTQNWGMDGTTNNATQAQDRPGKNQISGVLDANNDYGYDAAYSNCSMYSLGSARYLEVKDGIYGTATFTFCGTGFDVIGLTSNTTGTITVKVTNAETGANVKNLIVDTYYGLDPNGNVVEHGEENALYQVPVMKYGNMPYGKYEVLITAAYNDFFNHNNAADSYDLYIDAIRIYDPTGNQNDVANDAYVDDGEGWPVYEELRNNIIAAADFTVENGAANAELPGLVFIDSDKETASVADYISYGPNNELYLAKGQAIVFNLNLEDKAVAKVQLGMKSATGDEVSYVIADGSQITKAEDLTGASKTVLKTATDMYYDITGMKDKTIVIYNAGESGILSLTNIKVTFNEAPAESETLFYVNTKQIEKVLENINTVEPDDTVSDDVVTETIPGTDSTTGEIPGMTIAVPEKVTVGTEFEVRVETTSEVTSVMINNVKATTTDSLTWTATLTAANTETMKVEAVASYTVTQMDEETETEVEITKTVSVSANVKVAPSVTVTLPGLQKIGSEYEVSVKTLNATGVTVNGNAATLKDDVWSYKVTAGGTAGEEAVTVIAKNAVATTTVETSVTLYSAQIVVDTVAVKANEAITVKIATSSNVEKVTVNGKVLVSYTVSEGSRIWRTEISFKDTGEQELTVKVYDAEGYEDTAEKRVITVSKASEGEQVQETVKKIIGSIVAQLKKLFNW